MSEALPVLPDLRQTIGYLVADARGRVVGRVECPMYGTVRDIPDALSVRFGFLAAPATRSAATIEEIDRSSGVVGLKVDREGISRVSLETQAENIHNGQGVCPACGGWDELTADYELHAARGQPPAQGDSARAP